MIQLNHGYRKRFVTKLNGVAVAADALPTAILYRNGSASGVTVTVSTTAETGVYVATFTTNSAWAKTDHLELLVSATIDGDAGYKVVLWDSDGEVDAVMRGTDSANTIAPLDSTQTEAAAAAAITAADLPTAQEISDRLALDIDDQAGFWDGAVNTLGDEVANVVWAIETRTLTEADWETEQDAAERQTAVLAAIDGIEGGGGASVNVLPAVGIVADRSPGTTITPAVGETISQSITLYATDGTTPINLSGKTLAIVFETLQGVDVAVVASGNITISGSSSNVVTFAYPSVVTASERTLRFAIRDAAAPLTMYLQGLCVVTRAPQVD